MPEATTNRTLELIRSMGPKRFDPSGLPWGSRALMGIPGVPAGLSGAATGAGRLLGGPAGLAATAFPALWGSLDDSHFPDVKEKRAVGADMRRKAFESMFRGNTSPEDVAAAKRESLFAAGTDVQDADVPGPMPPIGAAGAPVLPPWMQGAQMPSPTGGFPGAAPQRQVRDLGPAVPGQMPQEAFFGGPPETNALLKPTGTKQPSFFEGFMGRLSKAGSKPDAALVPKLAHLFYGG